MNTSNHDQATKQSHSDDRISFVTRYSSLASDFLYNKKRETFNISHFIKANSLSKSILLQINKDITKQIKNNQKMMAITNSLNMSKRTRVMFKKEDDDKIIYLVNQFGTHSWSLIASFFDGKSAKQCRDRYSNYLAPGFFQGEWSKEEDELLKKLFAKTGSRWSVLKKSFPGRSAISIKNRWTYFLSKQCNINNKLDVKINNEKDEEDNIFNNIFTLNEDSQFLCEDNDELSVYSLLFS